MDNTYLFYNNIFAFHFVKKCKKGKVVKVSVLIVGFFINGFTVIYCKEGFITSFVVIGHNNNEYRHNWELQVRVSNYQFLYLTNFFLEL